VTYLLIAIGSALGGAARHACGVLIAQRFGQSFPWGTLFVNVTGSLAIGIAAAFVASHEKAAAAQTTRDFVMIGFLGGFTTFSAFSLQTLQLLKQHELGLAAANVVGSLVSCLIAVWVGYMLTERLTS
jgi:fluoride exporter